MTKERLWYVVPGEGTLARVIHNNRARFVINEKTRTQCVPYQLNNNTTSTIAFYINLYPPLQRVLLQ